MHRQVRENLAKASGQSDLVVAVFLDVRGFSSFARMAESSEAALFLRSMYSTILDEFPDTAFFKLTGDGLMLILHYDESNLTAVVNGAVRRAIDLVENFPEITSGDPMINFEVPGALGVGLARGAATRLGTGDLVLDYSGRPLNLAARLMDLARPAGVVFSDNLGHALLEDELAGQFKEDAVYVKGISEDSPMTVHFLASHTIVPPSAKRPFNRFETRTVKRSSYKVGDLESMGNFLLRLPEKPEPVESLRATIDVPRATSLGRKDPTISRQMGRSIEYHEIGGKPFARINCEKLFADLIEGRAKRTWDVGISVEYQVAEGTPPV